MKEYLYKLILATLILIGTTVVKASNEVYYINREGIEMTQEQYNNLVQLGFTEAQIYRMDIDTFEENKDLNATLMSETTTYYHTTTFMRNGIKFNTSEVLTEEQLQQAMQEYELQIQQPHYSPNTSGNFYNAIIEDDYKKMKATIAYLEDDDEMRFKNDIDWLTMPSTRSYDIIGIGIEPSKVVINSSIAFRQDWRTTSGNFDYGLTCYPKTETTGGSAMFKLPSGSINILESYTYFTVIKKPNVGTITSLNATGDYAHATSSVSDNVYNYYSLSVVNGITISSTYYNDYDTIPQAYAHFLGTW